MKSQTLIVLFMSGIDSTSYGVTQFNKNLYKIA